MQDSATTAYTAASTLDAVAQCTDFVATQAQAAGFSAARTREIEMVVEEIVANICRHGYGTSLGQVELACHRIDGDHLELEFVDRGAPFDMLAEAGPELAANIDIRDVGGVGTRVIRALIDTARYRRDGDRNVLCVVVSSRCRLGNVRPAR